MLRLSLPLSLACVLCACPPIDPPGDGGSGGGSGGGGGGGGALTPFEVTMLDADARDATYFAMAVDRAQDRVGVAYFSPRGTETMSGHADYDIKYVEWKAGQVSAVQTVRFVQRYIGIALVFDPTDGEPIIGYLGGAAGFVPGESIYWFQSDAVYSKRSNGTTWTETVVATDGNQVDCVSAVSNRGFLVGAWPAMTFDPTGKLYFAYRDLHAGQYPMQDWGPSDVELWEGGKPPTTGTCLVAGGDNKAGWGGHLQMILGADGQPAVLYDLMKDNADVNGRDVIFQRRNPTGTWTQAANVLTIPNTQTGAALAYDAQEGFGIAVLDRSTNQLSYTNSLNGTAWNALDPVFGSGTGGWYPSLAMDPVNHEPAIAYYICSPRGSVNETGCTTTEDKLMVTQRVVGTWRHTLVDEGGGYHPKVGFLNSGKRVVVYRTPPAIDPKTGLPVTNVGQLKIAVER